MTSTRQFFSALATVGIGSVLANAGRENAGVLSNNVTDVLGASSDPTQYYNCIENQDPDYLLSLDDWYVVANNSDWNIPTNNSNVKFCHPECSDEPINILYPGTQECIQFNGSGTYEVELFYRVSTGAEVLTSEDIQIYTSQYYSTVLDLIVDPDRGTTTVIRSYSNDSNSRNVTVTLSDITPDWVPESTPVPTFGPTFGPTVAPTFEPTLAPTPKPTFGPTFNPTLTPTPTPTSGPTSAPTPDSDKSNKSSKEFAKDRVIGAGVGVLGIGLIVGGFFYCKSRRGSKKVAGESASDPLLLSGNNRSDEEKQLDQLVANPTTDTGGSYKPMS